MTHLTEPLVPMSARAVKGIGEDHKWYVFAEGRNKKTYLIGTFEKEEFARKLATEWNTSSQESGWSRHASMSRAVTDSPTDPYHDVESWEGAFKRERSAYERLREESNQQLSQIISLQKSLAESEQRNARLETDKKLLRDIYERVLAEMTALKDAIRDECDRQCPSCNGEKVIKLMYGFSRTCDHCRGTGRIPACHI